MASQSRSSIKKSEQAFLLGVYASKRARPLQEISLDELGRLAETAGAVVCDRSLHELHRPNAATYIGKGLAEEIGQKGALKEIDVVIFDEDLSPTQQRNLEKIIGIKILDRTGLILDIFASRARSNEGKIQVELAQLAYTLPRLTGKGVMLSQLGGGIGTRGPGETKLELDRRKAHERLSKLKAQLAPIREHRERHRTNRAAISLPLVSLVGYTNAGKSTLMNQLTHAGVLTEDKLFATLDPTVRKLRLPSGREVLLADTVGFVRKLPHQLVEAFYATFEEAQDSALLLHVVDASFPYAKEQMKVVETVLKDLKLDQKPRITLYNKADKIPSIPLELSTLKAMNISALTGKGLTDLLEQIETYLSSSFRKLSLKLSYNLGSELSTLYRTSRILKRKDQADGIHLEVEVDEINYNKFLKYQD